MSVELSNVPLMISSSVIGLDYREIQIAYREKKDTEKIKFTLPIYDDQKNMWVLILK